MGIISDLFKADISAIFGRWVEEDAELVFLVVSKDVRTASSRARVGRKGDGKFEEAAGDSSIGRRDRSKLDDRRRAAIITATDDITDFEMVAGNYFWLV